MLVHRRLHQRAGCLCLSTERRDLAARRTEGIGVQVGGLAGHAVRQAAHLVQIARLGGCHQRAHVQLAEMADERQQERARVARRRQGRLQVQDAGQSRRNSARRRAAAGSIPSGRRGAVGALATSASLAPAA